MASGDTKTQQYLDIAANGTRADLPSDNCCNTRTQSLIVGVAERIMDVEDEVEELKNNPDVADIVATYADLQAYDTSKLTDKDVIRVLADETHSGDSTYYRFSKQSGTFTYIGESKQYTNFVGTDGTSAGAAGLVPAPATTDAGKYLKADGTWDSVQAGPTVVQAIGTSTTDVMSQDATTKMVYADTTRKKIKIGTSSSSYGTNSIGIGSGADASGNYNVVIGSGAGISSSSASGAIALGYGAKASQKGQFDVSTGNYLSGGYNNTNYRLLTGLYDPQNDHDAATKGYVDTAVSGAGSLILYADLADFDNLDTITFYKEATFTTPVTIGTVYNAVSSGRDIKIIARNSTEDDYSVRYTYTIYQAKYPKVCTAETMDEDGMMLYTIGDYTQYNKEAIYFGTYNDPTGTTFTTYHDSWSS